MRYFCDMISRIMTRLVQAKWNDGKAIIITGARQVGKTTLLNALAADLRVFWVNGDDMKSRQRLEEPSEATLKLLLRDIDLVVIDEAQRIQNIAIAVKLMVDLFPGIKILVSGSSALELRGLLLEPLTGRKWELQMFPFCFQEMADAKGLHRELDLMDQRLIYGYYPEAVNHPENADDRLRELANSYLYKDIFAMEQIKKPAKFEQLLKMLAYQVAQEVSVHELCQNLKLDASTVERYILLLEQAGVIFMLSSFQKNLRNELRKTRKVYFTDNGIRNAIIEDFAPLTDRMDAGHLWENWLMSERRKIHLYRQDRVKMYFWRTAAQQEIDLVEIDGKQMAAYEFKRKAGKTSKISQTFIRNYAPQITGTIHPMNVAEFLYPIS